jgi:hypothetical protein
MTGTGHPAPAPVTPTAPRQLTRADLKGMSSGQIAAARKAGQLADLLCPPEEPPDRDRIGGAGQLTRADLKGMTSDEITGARKAGRLTDLGVAAG